MIKRRKRKYFFDDVFHLEEEQREYQLFCKGQSKKYQVYSEWEAHISEVLMRLDSKEKLYNFKRFCISNNRVQARASDMYVNAVGVLLSAFAGSVITTQPLVGILTLVAVIAFLGVLIVQNKRIIKESYFFEDVLKVIEKIEKSKEKVDSN